MTQTATATRTVEARIWGVNDHGSSYGPMVKLYIGGREGIRQFRTSVPLSDSDQATWFQITLTDNVITGISL